MRSLNSLDRLDTAFDDDHLVADAGLLLPATLAGHLGFPAQLSLGPRPPAGPRSRRAAAHAVGRAEAHRPVRGCPGRLRGGRGDRPQPDHSAHHRAALRSRHAARRQPGWRSPVHEAVRCRPARGELGGPRLLRCRTGIVASRLSVQGSGQGAVSVVQPVRLLDLPSEPDVRLSSHPALRGLMPPVLVALSARSPSGSGSGRRMIATVRGRNNSVPPSRIFQPARKRRCRVPQFSWCRSRDSNPDEVALNGF